jgi:hypothetical protein
MILFNSPSRKYHERFLDKLRGYTFILKENTSDHIVIEVYKILSCFKSFYLTQHIDRPFPVDKLYKDTSLITDVEFIWNYLNEENKKTLKHVVKKIYR